MAGEPTSLSFTYNPLPNQPRVVFGADSITSLPDELKRLGMSKPLIVSTKGQAKLAEKVKSLLCEHDVEAAGIFAGAVMHTPVHVTEAATDFFNNKAADGVVSIGGGSTVGLGKAISLRHENGVKHMTIPTTYSGSEMTSILGETEKDRKITKNNPRVLPNCVIYDVNLTLSLPPAISATSGINAIAHAVETLYAQTANPITSLLALEGIRALASSLHILVKDPKDITARTKALYGSFLCGTCLASVGMALHHKLCHTLGGSFNLPHAETHTIVLPHALAYNMPALSEETTHSLAEALANAEEEEGDAAQRLNSLLKRLKVKRSLKELGMKEEDVDKAAEIATSNPYWNPRALEKDKLRELIRRAWAGEEARADL